MLGAEKYLKFLQFKIVRRLDGILQGDYSGLFYGPGMELAEVREYQPGDDVRHIDWNVTARTGRVHIRQFVEERELTAWLIVDTSASIDWGTTEQSKRDLALQFSSLAAHLYARHGNRVGLMTFSTDIDRLLPPRAGRLQTLRIIKALSGDQGSGAGGQGEGRRAKGEGRNGQPSTFNVQRSTGVSTSNLAGVLNRAMRIVRRRSLIFIVSDFLVPEGWAQPLKQLTSRHDVIVVRLVDPREREIPDIGLIRFEDPESGEQVWIDTGHKPTRERFRVAVAEREKALAGTLSAGAVDLLTLSTSETIVEPLLRFVALRKRRRPWNSLGR